MEWLAAAELDGEPPESLAWQAERHIESGRIREAIELCERGLRDAPSAALHHARGRAFQALGMREQALGEYRRAVTLGDWPLMPLRSAMRILATDPDGARLLAYCDGLPPAMRDTAVTRAYRAIALSKLGRHEEAAVLVDLDRHVMRVAFDPPAAFGGIAAFNEALAKEILGDPPAGLDGADTAINYRPRLDGPAMAALVAFTQTSMQAYLARLDEMGLAGVMPLPGDRAILQTATTVLRRDGRNRQHIHPRGLVSSVYHVRVPPGLDGNRGALVLGVCDEPAAGHQACWGTRHIRPVEGWLTLFPSHLFHDVVPSGIEAPRISVASDLCPR
ncbi:putative 2OG-Fe(II) oxygenase [Sphingomonas sp. AOB5]|uniref:putative 2OG-Fe(II) oxygenase n=1 Tax=Sphingomonas sp. AOB5 TaxID=3034017 RepID=UPI0023F825FA|nr:putative 2OG-Fe(II) oxygenase [Sphingomonas sp. AOB5]MDF7775262.1 putative 2OG-Fe(II) oxygenase [Sphingomonas sp. AOB5]